MKSGWVYGYDLYLKNTSLNPSVWACCAQKNFAHVIAIIMKSGGETHYILFYNIGDGNAKHQVKTKRVIIWQINM